MRPFVRDADSAAHDATSGDVGVVATRSFDTNFIAQTWLASAVGAQIEG
jgi:hypothetical protein